VIENCEGLSAFVVRPLSEAEGWLIAETLQFTGQNREEAARLLGIGERTLYRKIKEYNLRE
jgi:two-component system, NtrC family, response regulator HydG